MAVETFIFDNEGSLLARLPHEVSRSWRLNGIGKAKITMPTDDAKATETILRYGNFVLIRSTDVIDWGGFIWTPRTWGASEITINALSAEAMLGQRVIRRNYKAAIPGKVFLNVLRQMKGYRINTRLADISMAGVWDKGIEQQNKIVYDAVTELADKAGHEWWIEPRLSNRNRLSFRAFWQPRRESLGDPMVSPANIAVSDKKALQETGGIATAVLAIGSGTTDKKAPVFYLESTRPVEKYGLIQALHTVDSERLGEVKRSAWTYLKNNAKVIRRFALNGVVGDGMTKTLEPGSVHEMLLPNIGFTGKKKGTRTFVRVVSMAYNEVTGVVSLYADEEHDVEDETK